MSQYKALIREIKYLTEKNIIATRWNLTEKSMDYGNYMVIVTWTTQEIIKPGKAWQDMLSRLAEQSFFGIREVRKQLRYLLQKLNIQKLRRYIVN